MAGIASREDAAERERAAAMPSPERAARRGIIVGRYMGLTEGESAMMVMTAVRAAIASAVMGGVTDTSWLNSIHSEAARVYARTAPPLTP